MKSKIKKTVDDHDLVETCIKITPCLKRAFLRYSAEKGKNSNNMASLAHGIRMAGAALLKRYGIATPENISVNYQ
ncbi:MAG: hypothetical protein IMZ58_08510 [Thermoplasmata archaeon]|nr:hypothetical protein [Thermoplasmata archaeon]